MIKKNNAAELEKVFIDVRKAYRLLYRYQRLVLDVVKVIGDLLSREYYGGWSKFSNPAPGNGKGALDKWAWDWLNMYCYEFHFGSLSIDGNNISFSVWLISDTGYYDSEDGDERNLESFSSIENSATKLLLVVGKNTWHSKIVDIENNLQKVTTDYVVNNGEGVLVARSYNLSEFLNMEKTRANLENFISFCHRNNISELNILKKN